MRPGPPAAVKDDYDYRSFGDIVANYGTAPSDNHYVFTGYESDSGDNGTDFGQFRSLSLTMARFNRPDPYSRSYNPANPQSFNRYSYVLNDPLIYVDPMGLKCVTMNTTDDDGNTVTYQADDGDGNGCAAAGVAPGTGSDPIQPTPITVNSGPNSPGDFTFDVSSDEFIQLLQSAGFFVSVPDTMLGKTPAGHPGINLRDFKPGCTVHVNIDPGSGANGKPVTGSWHYDSINPYASEGGLGNHLVFDVIPDYLWSHNLSFVTVGMGANLPPIVPTAGNCP